MTLLIKKPKPQISPFTKNLTFGNNRDPWGGGVKGCLAFSQNSSTFWVMSVPYLNVFWLNSCSPQPLSFDVNDLTDKIKRNGGAPTAPPSAHIPRLGFSSLLSSPTHIWPEHTHSDKTWLTYLCTIKIPMSDPGAFKIPMNDSWALKIPIGGIKIPMSDPGAFKIPMSDSWAFKIPIGGIKIPT